MAILFKVIGRLFVISIKNPAVVCVCVCVYVCVRSHSLANKTKICKIKSKGKNNEENILKEKLLSLLYS